MAFEKTGIFLFNPKAIHPEQMKPAETTSIKGSFAVTATSPVKAIMKSYRTHSLASFDVSPTHPLPSLSSSEISSQPVASSSCLPITPTAPRRRRLYSSGLDETPSKWIRIMTSEIAATSSGSFLVSKDPYTSSTPFPRMLERQPLDLPAPDWHLLVPPTSNAKGYIAAFADREETLEAQMVIQDMTLVKMKAALHAKETKKAEKNDNEVLLNDGMGRLWTDAKKPSHETKKSLVARLSGNDSGESGHSGSETEEE
ncbi:hypothetical protein C8R42DRAFT_669053 [Lentinula raphanica]|nr:hypothetical protein C8R42DRAFT_669053 [Lentinula raphanica]